MRLENTRCLARGSAPGPLRHIALWLWLAAAAAAQASEPVRVDWFPDASRVARFTWTDERCEACTPLVPPPEWRAMARLAGLERVRFLRAAQSAYGPAWSFAPGTVVVSDAALKLPHCQLDFIVGHELVHIAQRHFDEDAHDVSVLSGKPPTWTHAGEDAMALLDGDFPLALRMSPLWQQQEREADWAGALLAAQACGCRLEDSALAYLGADTESGGGVISTHDESAERVRFLRNFIESARRLTRRMR